MEWRMRNIKFLVMFARLRRLKLHGQNAPKTASQRHCKKIVLSGGT